jgi:hypothetical protein
VKQKENMKIPSVRVGCAYIGLLDWHLLCLSRNLWRWAERHPSCARPCRAEHVAATTNLSVVRPSVSLSRSLTREAKVSDSHHQQIYNAASARQSSPTHELLLALVQVINQEIRPTSPKWIGVQQVEWKRLTSGEIVCRHAARGEMG